MTTQEAIETIPQSSSSHEVTLVESAWSAAWSAALSALAEAARTEARDIEAAALSAAASELTRPRSPR